jgi:hypothetical protein
LALEGEGITWTGQPSRQEIALFSVRIEFWRSTGIGIYRVTFFACALTFAHRFFVALIIAARPAGRVFLAPTTVVDVYDIGEF